MEKNDIKTEIELRLILLVDQINESYISGEQCVTFLKLLMIAHDVAKDFVSDKFKVRMGKGLQTIAEAWSEYDLEKGEGWEIPNNAAEACGEIIRHYLRVLEKFPVTQKRVADSALKIEAALAGYGTHDNTMRKAVRTSVKSRFNINKSNILETKAPLPSTDAYCFGQTLGLPKY